MKMKKTLWTMPVCSAKIPLRAFKEMWNELYPNETKTRYWTGHSVRVGGAIQLNIEGYSLPQIMEMGNWSNEEMVMRYIRNIEAGKKQ